MSPWTMWLVGAAVALLPLALMVAFNGADRADSRGRRTDRTWRVPAPGSPATAPKAGRLTRR